MRKKGLFRVMVSLLVLFLVDVRDDKKKYLRKATHGEAVYLSSWFKGAVGCGRKAETSGA